MPVQIVDGFENFDSESDSDNNDDNRDLNEMSADNDS